MLSKPLSTSELLDNPPAPLFLSPSSDFDEEPSSFFLSPHVSFDDLADLIANESEFNIVSDSVDAFNMLLDSYSVAPCDRYVFVESLMSLLNAVNPEDEIDSENHHPEEGKS